MAKQGKRPVRIPDGVKASLEGTVLKMSGPMGNLGLEVPPVLSVVLEKGSIRVDFRSAAGNGERKNETENESLRSLYRALINSRMKAVKEGITKQLEVIGVGYQAELKGKNLVLKIGFSHPVSVPVPSEIKVKVEKNLITLAGSDPQQVGDFAARVRGVRPPEPYGGKGIRYQGEYVRQKVGKTAGATGTTK
ncbi:MAG TPA: 50S ribosomal protein L6 [bacterium]|uniref:50S ribosomal protein L6 n=1 Tax=candidate division TA06 bacterium ADurb.Bin417 TaxID=1852828 RepID=A0A1V5MIX4_UNCT6|nr:MAG: 50S ribosomal protein L6 [candidate division TA06 bacterium ADurb.Bin417]HNS49283.1 50S ribosomal protein L6 [bacterium]